MRIGRVGLQLRLDGTRYEIDSEMLNPPMSIVVYFSASSAARDPQSERIRRYVDEALTFSGFRVEYI